MPIFEYHCADCDEVFEELVRVGEEREALPCPACTGRRTQRLLSVFAGHGGEGKASQNGGGGAHSCGSPACCRVPR